MNVGKEMRPFFEGEIYCEWELEEQNMKHA